MKSEYLETALDAVKQAEVLILKYLDQGVRAQLKADDSPVTIADQEAEETIKRVILNKFPDHTFLEKKAKKLT